MKKEIFSAKVAKSNLRDEKIEVVPRNQERRRPIPRQNYTIEELFAKIPEPKVEVRKHGISEEIDTGSPVGREFW